MPSTWIVLTLPQYVPQTGDLILATVHNSSAEVYQCAITQNTAFGQLPQLAFEGATKKTRPHLRHGSLVYARITNASKFFDPELVCFNPATGKSEGLGELKGGHVFDISLSMAKRLLMPKQAEQAGLVVLDALAEKIAFEVAVGKNGKIWIDAGTVRGTLLVGNALMQTDKSDLDVHEQTKFVKQLLSRHGY